MCPCALRLWGQRQEDPLLGTAQLQPQRESLFQGNTVVSDTVGYPVACPLASEYVFHSHTYSHLLPNK